MADYGVKFNNSGSVAVPLWHSNADPFSISIPFRTGALTGTDGLIGRTELSTPVSYIALYADGKYVVRLAGVTQYISPTGLLSATTNYVIKMGRTGASDCYVTLLAADGLTVINTTTFSTSASFSFNSIGSVGISPLAFDGVVWRVDVTGGQEGRAYLSTINTGTNWAETISGQNGTLTGLAVDGSEWELAPVATTPIAFTGTIPNFVYDSGDVINLDLSSYFSGTETPFTSTATVLPLLGLSLDTAFILSGTASEGVASGIVITGTDSATSTAISNTFNITVSAPVVIPTRLDIESADETSGLNPPFLLNDFDVGDLSSDTFSFTIDVQPTGGVLVTTELSTFVFSGAPDGSYFFTYTGYKNGTSYGSATVNLNIGDSSILNMSVTEAGNDTLRFSFYDRATKKYIKDSEVAFSSDLASVNFNVKSGVVIGGFYDGATPPTTGTGFYGVTV